MAGIVTSIKTAFAEPRTRLFAVLAVLLIGYGVPLTKGWWNAREYRDPEALRSLLEQEAEAAQAAYVYLHWVTLLQDRFPGDQTREFLLRRREFPRPLMRHIVHEAIWRNYRDHPDTTEIVRGYIANPRENFSLRNRMLHHNPDMAESEIGLEAREIIEAQRGFFPNREGIRVYY